MKIRRVSADMLRGTAKQPDIRIRRVSANMLPADDVNHPKIGRRKRQVAPLVVTVDASPSAYVPHGDRVGRAVIEPCPNCLYAYADGGYCPECGWTRPMGRVHPYGTLTGRRYTR